MKILTVLIAALILSSCSSTHQTRDIFKPSGFLKDYSKLRPGKEDQAQMRYVEQGVVFTKFKKITIDPIEVWASNESELKQIPYCGFHPQKVVSVRLLHLAALKYLESMHLLHCLEPGKSL